MPGETDTGFQGISDFSATATGGHPNDPTSPNKRHCGRGKTLTLQMFQDTLQGEPRRERAELRKEINGALKGVTARIDAMEKILEQHGSRTLQAFETFETFETLTTAQAEQGEKIQAVITGTAALSQRLTALQDVFVPGVRRGFALIPLKPRTDETEEEMRQRVQACIRRVSQAGDDLGPKPDGNRAKLWLAVSQQPEKRRRAALAGKVKCLSIEASTVGLIEPEWATRTVWFNGHRVASATTTQRRGHRSRMWMGRSGHCRPSPADPAK